MGRATVETAAKLLAKAQSTTSDEEAMALVERCYELLARVINAHDEANPVTGQRRRERRRLAERRRRARADAADAKDATASGPTEDSLARYRHLAGDGTYSWRSGVDVSL
jgi:hypothetical protein